MLVVMPFDTEEELMKEVELSFGRDVILELRFGRFELIHRVGLSSALKNNRCGNVQRTSCFYSIPSWDEESENNPEEKYFFLKTQ